VQLDTDATPALRLAIGDAMQVRAPGPAGVRHRKRVVAFADGLAWVSRERVPKRAARVASTLSTDGAPAARG